MGWRENYRTASFRGIEFHMDGGDSGHGRRQAVHQAAQRDVPYTEDMGRKAREFSVNGYLLGKEYNLQRDDLIKACEQAGPGQLIHPYRGELTVVCRGLTVSETAAEGGKCTVSMTFLEAGDASFPATKVDTVNAISTKGNEVTSLAETDFVEKYVTKGYPSFVAEAASSKIKALSEYLSNPGFNLDGNLQSASDFAQQIQSLGSDVASLIQQPSDLASSIISAVTGVRSAFGANAFSMLTSLFDKQSSSSSSSTAAVTPSRAQVVKNSDAVDALVRQTAIAEAAKAAVVTEVATTTSTGSTLVFAQPVAYDSYESAITVRETLVDRLDSEAESTISDGAYVALTDLRTAVTQAVPSPDESLPHLAEYSPRETLPSLLVAYQLYGDAARGDEIVTRNMPRHPGFLTGGQALEVLADG